MNSSSYYETNWNDFPNEVKFMIIQKTGNNCKLSLRACSRADQQLVDSVPFRTVYKMRFINGENRWRLDIMRTAYGCGITFRFNNFEDFQQKLTEEVNHVDYIYELSIFEKDSSKLWKLSSINGSLLKVGKLFLKSGNFNPVDILKQIEPSHLKLVKLLCNEVQPEVFNLPQIVHAEVLHTGRNFIRNDQLIKLEAQKLRLRLSENLTSAGIQKYVQKCLANLDKSKVDFTIGYQKPRKKIRELFSTIRVFKKDLSNGVTVLDSNSLNYQLEIEETENRIEGRTIYKNRNKNRPSSLLGSVETIILDKNQTKSMLTIERKKEPLITFEENSADEIQNKLTETIKRVNYIRHLQIWDTSQNWKFSSENQQITVGKLTLLNANNSPDYLRQIEPRHLKEIRMVGLTDNPQIYVMPQMVHALRISILNSCIKDDELLNLNAIQLELDTMSHENLTAFGINQFLKKCVNNLDRIDFNIKIHSVRYLFTKASEMFKELEILSPKRNPDGDYENLVNSPYSEFQLLLTFTSNSLEIKRITKSEKQLDTN